MQRTLITLWKNFTHPLVVLLGTFLLVAGCSTVSNDGRLMQPKAFSGASVPDWIYEPEYYVYKNGRYRFVKGHYRKILFRKQFRKRSLLGYGSPEDTAAR
jgi:hypothetical protein